MFAKLAMKGNIKSAMRWLDDSSSDDPLALDDVCDKNGSTVRDYFYAKHPPGQPALQENVTSSTSDKKEPHPVIFNRLCSSLIKSVVMRTDGAVGPSWVDAAGWRRLCSCFKRACDDLCTSLAAVARKLCTCLVDPAGLSAFVAERLIALDKHPGVQPIGISKVCRRFIAKVVLRILQPDIQEACSYIDHFSFVMVNQQVVRLPYMPSSQCIPTQRVKGCTC